MEDSILFKLELNIAAKKIFGQVMIDQAMVTQQMEQGINKAINAIDLSEAVAEEAKKLINKAIQEALWGGELKELVKKKIQGVVDSITEKEIAHWTK